MGENEGVATANVDVDVDIGVDACSLPHKQSSITM
jgi:hypothetical protein